MAWKQSPSTYYLAAGQAAEFWFSWGGVWQGPQFAAPVVDASTGGAGDRTLIVQQYGTWNHVIPGGAVHNDYLITVYNRSSVNVWFHLEGGGAT
jgi:hypothetical protein